MTEAQQSATAALLDGEPAAASAMHRSYSERDYESRASLAEAIERAYELAALLAEPAPDAARVRVSACDVLAAAVMCFHRYDQRPLQLAFFDFMQEPSGRNRERFRELAEEWASGIHLAHMREDVGAAVDYLIEFFGDQDYVLVLIGASEAQLRRWRLGGGTNTAVRNAIRFLLDCVFLLRERLSRAELIEWLERPNECLSRHFGQPSSPIEHLLQRHPRVPNAYWILKEKFGLNVYKALPYAP